MKNKIKKILFLNMPNTVLDNFEKAKYMIERQSVSNVPYGLLSICSYIKKYSQRNIELKVFDLNEEIERLYRNNVKDTNTQIFESFKELVRNFQPDIVGITIMFNINYMYLNNVADSIKKISNDIIIFVGGNLATSLYEEITLRENIDCVCFGEGEIPMLKLINSDDPEKFIKECDSFVTKDKLKNPFIPKNMMVPNLDDIPPIDFDFVDLSCYRGPMTRFFERDDDYEENEPMTLVIYTTRGCPFTCCFCACSVVHGRGVRFMSKDKVISDIKRLIDKYNITCIMINDDNFIIRKDRAKEIFEELIKFDLKVVFPSLLTRNIDDEIASLLKKVKVDNQLISIESGSEYVLKHLIHKPLTKEQIYTAVENMRRHDITVDTNVVIGFPGETDEHRQETLQTIYNAGFNWSHFLIALPVPGSTLYKECKENNYLVNEDNFYSPNLSQCNIQTPEYSPEHIQKQAYMMNLHANFVHNYNVRAGNYDVAIQHFSNILKSFPDHAFAFYGLMKAYEGKGDEKNMSVNRNKFREISNNDPFWKEYAEYFNLL